MKRKIVLALYILLFAIFTYISYEIPVIREFKALFRILGADDKFLYLYSLILLGILNFAYLVLGYVLLYPYFKSNNPEIKRFIAISVFCLCVSVSGLNFYKCITRPVIRVYVTAKTQLFEGGVYDDR